MVLLSWPVCPRALRVGCRQLGQGACLFPSLFSVSRWNMGTNCLCEVEAGEKGQGVFRGSNGLLTWQLLFERFCFLGVGAVGEIGLD